MSGLEVAACVASIVSAFGTGLDVLRAMRAKRQAKKLKRQQVLQNELQVQQSLERGPLEIQAEYDRYFVRMGERFAAGDPIAHTSLAHTLLILNSGIMQILSASIAADLHTSAHAGNSLITLSDSSKVNTVRALGQLHQRLLESSIMLSRSPRNQDSCTCGEESGRRKAHHRKNESKGSDHGHESKRRGGNVGARGGTGSSKSTNTNSKVDYAWVRSKKRPPLSTHSGRSSRSNSSETTLVTATGKASKESSGRPSRSNSSETTLVTATGKASKESRGQSRERRSSNSSQKEPKQVTVPISPSPNVEGQQTSFLPQFPTFDLAPSNVTPRRADRVTPSMYSFMSDSTKLGEIPEHKWVTPPSHQVADRFRQPVTLPTIPHFQEEAKEKPGLGKRLFRNFLKPPAASPVLA